MFLSGSLTERIFSEVENDIDMFDHHGCPFLHLASLQLGFGRLLSSFDLTFVSRSSVVVGRCWLFKFVLCIAH